MKTLLPAVLSITLGVGLLPGMAAAASKPLYRWVDEQGRVHYGDKIPPVAAKREIEKLDDTGRVRTSRPRELTVAEVQAAEEVSSLGKELEQRRKIRAARDKSLLVTFGAVEELERARDEQLSIIDQRLLLVEKALVENDAALSKSRADFGKLKNPSEVQKKQLAAAEAALAEAQKNSVSLHQQRGATEKKFADDIERFKALKAAPG